jgi:short chain dehydrogenase
MARVFITGSADGLGLMVGRHLADQEHKVVLHARNDARAADAKKALPKAEAVVVGDLASITATKDVARQVNALGPFDAVIHNAAVGFQESHRVTGDGLPHVFAHQHARALCSHRADRTAEAPRLSEFGHARARKRPSRRYPVAQAALGRIVGLRREQAARRHAGLRRRASVARCPVQRGNARLGRDQNGRGGPDDIDQAHLTQAWLATSDDPAARTAGGYFYHLKQREPNPETRDAALQDRLIGICGEISGVDLPEP